MLFFRRKKTEGVDYFETYAPVVIWSTVRLSLTLILLNGWNTKHRLFLQDGRVYSILEGEFQDSNYLIKVIYALPISIYIKVNYALMFCIYIQDIYVLKF